MAKLGIAFFGIGAVGGYYGGMAAARYQGTIKAGIFLIARRENLKAIREKGLQIQLGIRTIYTVPALATDNPAEIGPVNYLFCYTKSYGLEGDIQQLKPAIRSKTVIIPLLNGSGIEERVHNILPGREVWKGCVYIGSRLTELGVVEKFSLKEHISFDNKDADEDRQIELPKLLIYARLNVFNPASIDLRIWKKFLMISTVVTVMSFFNQPVDEVLAQHIDLFIALDTGLKNVTKAMGVSLPDDIIYTSIETQKIIPAGSATSMHSDFLVGRETKLEALTGYVIRQAEKLGVDVPTYRFMYNGLSSYPYPKNQ